ncbi:hypothetical protein CCR75_005806 [Bremia lactucae]|uniref:IPO4/5-like TPR repeats domain-containing protein n=1 Tax=Bremia lactucae TaxID=4779 RepID=A0A976FMW6_BRELC|nr:hypothetical protein CCR75_005806 [Bremia lactucae]
MAESSWEALLWSFLAVDNVTRNAAEAHFAILKQASCSDELLLGLVHVIHSTSPDDIRALAAVLLRRVLLRDTVSLWPRATEQARHIIKKELVAILAAGEKNRSIRRKVCDTVGELASSILEDGQWDSLFPTLLQWSKASIVFLREAALRILEMIAVVLASQISQSTLETIGTPSLHSIVLDILSKGLQDREGRVAMNSLRALSMVLLHLDALEQSFRPEVLTAIVPLILALLHSLLDLRQMDDVMEALEVCIEIAEPHAMFFSPCFQELVDLLVRVAEPSLNDILDVLDADNLDAIANYLFAQAMDPHPRVCCTAVDVIGQLSVDQAPRFQESHHAEALKTLARFLDDCTKPRLQAHAATALRQFIDMCPPSLLPPYLDQLLHQLFALLQHAKFVAAQEKHKSTSAYITARVVQEQAITAISSIATVAGTSFTEYYAVVVPSLQQILYNCLEESVHVTKNSTSGLKPLPTVCSSATLGGIALECLSLIGQAVGKHVFARDAASILKVMAEMQATPSIVNNELIRTYLLQAWARCCTCLGQDFAPYLPLVMPTLLEAATQQAEFEVDPSRLASDDEDEELTDSEDTQLAHVNGKCLSIRTSILEDKATACQLLAGMVTDLEDAFFPYAEQATQLLAPLLTESVHSDIRAAAIYAMPALVKCVAISTATCLNKGSVAMRQMLDFVLGRLVNALKSEPDVELVIRIMQSMIQCLNDTQDLHPLLLLNEAQLQEVVHGILVILGDSFQRRAMRRSLHSSDFNDDDDTNVQVDAMQDMETELHFVLAECIGTLAKTHRSAFFPVFQSLLWDKVAALAARDCLREDRQLALFVIDDVLEYCGKPAWRLLDVFVPVLQSALQEIMEPDLIQAAAFGVGICASHGGDAFTPYAKQCLKLLDPIVTHPNAQKQTRRNATDNAVAALGKLCEYHAEAVDASKLFPQWLALLPLRGDLEESFAVCRRLCGYIQDSHTLVLGGRDRYYA